MSIDTDLDVEEITFPRQRRTFCRDFPEPCKYLPFNGLARKAPNCPVGLWLASNNGRMKGTHSIPQTLSSEGRRMQRGDFLAMIHKDGEVYRFVIRDCAGSRPSIHGYGRNLDEAHAKVNEILGALDSLEQLAA